MDRLAFRAIFGLGVLLEEEEGVRGAMGVDDAEGVEVRMMMSAEGSVAAVL